MKINFGPLNINLNVTVRCVDEPKKPGQLVVFLKGERLMAQINVQDFTVALPPKSDVDVVSRRLRITPDAGNPALASEFILSAPLGEPGPASQDITVLEGGTYGLELVDIDNVGNESPASTFSFTASDSVAPPAPGDLGVAFVAERIIDVP